MYRFRILQGKHIEKNPEGKIVQYTQGETFVTNSDLRYLNAPGMSPKFLFISDDKTPGLPDGASVCPMCQQPILSHGTPAPIAPVAPMKFTGPDQSSSTLMAMSDQELKNIAAEEEIELGEFDSRETIIAKIQAATLV